LNFCLVVCTGLQPLLLSKGYGFRPFVDELPRHVLSHYDSYFALLDESQKATAESLFSQNSRISGHEPFTSEAKVLIAYCLDGVSGSQCLDELIFSHRMSPFFRVLDGEVEVAWSKTRLANNCLKRRWEASIPKLIESTEGEGRNLKKEALACLIGYKLGYWSYSTFAATKIASQNANYEEILEAIDEYHEVDLSAKISSFLQTDLDRDALSQYFAPEAGASSANLAQTEGKIKASKRAVRSSYDYTGKIAKFINNSGMIFLNEAEDNQLEDEDVENASGILL